MLPNFRHLVIEADELPKHKGDKKIVNGSFVDPTNPEKSFRFYGATLEYVEHKEEISDD